MRKYEYAIYDIKSKTHGDHYSSVNDETAIREFSMAINSGNARNLMAQHPEDFTLFFIGWYDYDTAELEKAEGGNRSIVNGMQLVDQSVEQLTLPFKIATEN